MSKFVFPFFFVSVFLVVLSAACGRTTLDSYDLPELDASLLPPPPATCSPTSCPRGCCDSAGNCRAGTAREACGTFGESCDDCPREGFPLCDASARSCARTVERCDAESCADGCCSIVNGSAVCLRGEAAGACGTGGETCQNCTDAGLSCDATTRSCVGQPCNAETCANGCCLGNQCLGGLEETTCGGGGAECENCDATGRACSPNPQGVGGVCTGTPSCSASTCSGCCDGDFCLPGGDSTACGGGANTCDVCDANEQCVLGVCQLVGGCNATTCPSGCCLGDQCLPGSDVNACGIAGDQCANCQIQGETCTGQACAPAACNAANCPDGCCAGGVCQPRADSTCGSGGGQCQDCAADGRVCETGSCVVPCTEVSCGGCCNGNVCEAGFLNDTCGSGGQACSNCGAAASICNVDALPRSCVDTADCPAAYDACPAGVSLPVPPMGDSCNAQLLANAAAACSQGPNTTGCQNFFAQLTAQPANAACAQCLSPFRYTFASQRGLVNCLSPFVSASCNRTVGCAFDCEDRSCEACAPVATGACRQNVRQDQCGAYFAGASCLAGAVFGAGSFCNPQAYNGYGEWLREVGRQFCDTAP